MYGLPSLQTFLLTLTYYLSIITCIHGLTDISIQAFANFQQNSIPPAGAPTPKALEQNQAEFIGEQLTLSIGGQQTQEQQIVRVIQHNEYENEQGDGEVVLLGEDPTTCNVMGDLEVEGSDLWMGPTPTYTKSAQQCCILCKGNEDCNAWTWCSNPQGCDSDKESYTQCKLKYDERVAVAPRWKNEGMGWISGFTLSNCPIMSVFERQRVDYSHFQNTCRDKNSMCTTCMCSLLEEFEQWPDFGCEGIKVQRAHQPTSQCQGKKKAFTKSYIFKCKEFVFQWWQAAILIMSRGNKRIILMSFIRVIQVLSFLNFLHCFRTIVQILNLTVQDFFVFVS
eukprot:TRINITY_DN17292_c0_g1_i1.p1 TRINITY_DN17292_c0_g1~~TRINITY_DN17292_c0_g1_i1.p1  ORF type:complete len:337 (-),score=31.38 TRINITY_DN17292_c0_g1_i1:239-1249(-)